MPIRYSSVVGGSSSSGFNLDIGSSGNTTFVFSEAQPAGGYSITSQLADSTIEFYAIAEDGTLAGYTNTKALTATQDFYTMVVYGASNNDLITFEFKPTTLPTGAGDRDSGAAPFVTSVSDADLANIDDTTIITGGNFATDVTVTFTGTDSVVRNAKSVVRTNSTQLIVTRPDEMIEDNSPYTVTVSNPGIPQSAYKTFTSSVTAGGDPVWVTAAGALPGVEFGQAYSTTVEATDPDGGNITYSLATGSLPTGLSLNSSTGEISGTASGVSQTFTIAATDTGGNVTNRTFDVSISLASGGSYSVDGGYAYHTFTSSGTFDALADIPEVEYLIVAGGGGGGQNGGGGGAGGLISSTTSLTSNTYSVEIGAGGNGGGTGPGQDGSNSTAFSKVALGGGGGAGGSTTAGRDGGSGGGVLRDSSASGGAGTQPSSASGGFGNPGGSGQANTYAGGGGGGGASSAGGMGPPSGPAGPSGNPGDYYAGSGGAGMQWLDGNYYAGGGGGGAFQMVPDNLPTYGLGGIGGGGQGANDGEDRGGYNTAAYFRDAVAGSQNTGGGGGGALTYNFGTTPKAGGSGIVIIRYPI